PPRLRGRARRHDLPADDDPAVARPHFGDLRMRCHSLVEYHGTPRVGRGSRPSSSPWMTEAGNILHKDLALTAGNNRPYPDSDGSEVNRAPFRGAGESEAPGERFRVSGHEPRGRGAVMDDLEPHPVPGAHRRGRERVVDERGAIAGDVLGDRPEFHFSAVVRELERAGLQFRAGRKPFDAD